MGPLLSFASKSLLGFALIAGDPDLEWSTGTPGTPASEPATPAPSAAPTVAADTTPVVSASPVREPLDKNFRLSLGLDVGVSPSSYGALGLSVELDWYVFRYLRLNATIGSGWLPGQSYGCPYCGYDSNLTNTGAFRILAGFDGVLPFSWGELFAGIQTGTVYTGAAQYVYYGQQWDWVPSLRVRGGVDFTVARPVVIGVDLAYAQFARAYAEMHWAEAHVRAGFAF